jgi:hypothetical protein
LFRFPVGILATPSGLSEYDSMPLGSSLDACLLDSEDRVCFVTVGLYGVNLMLARIGRLTHDFFSVYEA